MKPVKQHSFLGTVIHKLLILNFGANTDAISDILNIIFLSSIFTACIFHHTMLYLFQNAVG